MKDLNSENTRFGFIWNNLHVERVHYNVKNGKMVLFLCTQKQMVEIYVSKGVMSEWGVVGQQENLGGKMDELYEYLKKRVERLEEIGKCIPEHEIFNQTIHQAKLSEVLR